MSELMRGQNDGIAGENVQFQENCLKTLKSIAGSTGSIPANLGRDHS
jgi:hypothetical protein